LDVDVALGLEPFHGLRVVIDHHERLSFRKDPSVFKNGMVDRRYRGKARTGGNQA